jgi:hypothetical protein
MRTAALLYGRNDNYKEFDRVAVCLTSMLDTFDEVWFLDWNTPEDRYPILWEIKDKIPSTGRLNHIIIPESAASAFTYNNPDAQACVQVLATNIMLRRCMADWIVATTIDIIAPNRILFNDFIKNADKNTFYTISRRDVDYTWLEKVGFNNWKTWRDELDKVSQPRYFPAKVTPNDEWSLINCCGDFQLAHRDVWNTIKGFEEKMIYACFQDTNVQKKAKVYGFDLKAHYDLPIYHLSHKGMGNDGSSPSKQHYNDAYHWVEFADKSENLDTWGFSNVEIEYEVL